MRQRALRAGRKPLSAPNRPFSNTNSPPSPDGRQFQNLTSPLSAFGFRLSAFPSAPLTRGGPGGNVRVAVMPCRLLRGRREFTLAAGTAGPTLLIGEFSPGTSPLPGPDRRKPPHQRGISGSISKNFGISWGGAESTRYSPDFC